ncbi:MAG: nucleotidyl transferase AbiEii/AbiGii toxin family protein [Deltaproteobacteria bacterium]|nr:nucleotidyl transferase AbiEii/AbiGii toxin family protein [Deltaproteobacteria bacterium]
MIPQRNISLLSNRLARDGGRRIREAVLERDYCLAWFLVGLSRAPLRERLAFKGGTAIKRCYFGDYRFSEDLDFTLTEEVPFETLRVELEPIFKEVQRASAIMFRLEREDRQRHVNSHTFYLAYDGPLPARTPSEVKVDVTIRECLVLPLVERPIVRGYEEYEDLPDGATLRVYSLEEISVEKVVALGDRARNEPRDLYDIWHLTSEGHVDLDPLKSEVEKKLEFRGRALTTLGEEFLKKEARLKRLWSARLAAQMAELPEFDRVFRAVHRSLRQAGLAG